MGKSINIISHSPEETVKIGTKIAPFIGIGKIVYLNGDLGTGKTTLVQGITSYYNCLQRAKSPTFIIISSYKGDIQVHHCDLFRINNSEEIFDLSIEEYLETGNLIIEWPEKASIYLPPPTLEINFQHTSSDTNRNIILYSENEELIDAI
tara:strand:+ start:256 stop:705 length:450 start_codon:yes stop_codon:yes gene_type:complete